MIFSTQKTTYIRVYKPEIYLKWSQTKIEFDLHKHKSHAIPTWLLPNCDWPPKHVACYLIWYQQAHTSDCILNMLISTNISFFSHVSITWVNRLLNWVVKSTPTPPKKNKIFSAIIHYLAVFIKESVQNEYHCQNELQGPKYWVK